MNNKMKFQVQELRPEVLAFALLMEERLREKDVDKGSSWKKMNHNQLRVHASSKMASLENSILRELPYDAHHAVDLANYCMMIADVCDLLNNIPKPKSMKRGSLDMHFCSVKR